MISRSGPETLIRLSIEEGLQRLRSMRSQGYRFTGKKCLLNLMRNLRVIRLEGFVVKIPLVYTDEWLFDGRMKTYWETEEKNFATMFASKEEAPSSDADTYPADNALHVHRTLVQALNDYLKNYRRSGLILDVIKHPAGAKTVYTNVNAYYSDEAAGTCNLLKNLSSQVPSLLLDVRALMRITFPLSTEKPNSSYQMGTIVLGLVFEFDKDDATTGTPVRKKNGGYLFNDALEQMEQVADQLLVEIPNRYNAFVEDDPAVRKSPQLSLREDEEERDELHAAIDYMHTQIRRLVGYVPEERRPSLSLKRDGFVIAFREINPSNLYHSILRYRLTKYNYESLRESLEPPNQWEEAGLYKELRESLFNLFSRRWPQTARRESHDFIQKCKSEVNAIFREVDQPYKALPDIRKKIESSPYPMHQTPGYHVMRLGYPEIIKDWMSDPRAVKFKQYPPFLLVWESLTLPKEIYYSPIADGGIFFGVCGMNAGLLNFIDSIDLQRIIDDSAPRIRTIICNEMIRDLNKGLIDAYSSGQTGTKLWEGLARIYFQKLAYYYLPDTSDYSTKLVHETSLIQFERKLKALGGRWEWDDATGCKSLPGEMIHHLQDELRKIAIAAGTDFIAEDLAEPQNLKEAILYRLELEDKDDYSLLVLVPSRENRQRAADLIRRFKGACAAARSSYRKQEVLRIDGHEFRHQLVYLMAPLRQGLAHATEKSIQPLRLIADMLQYEIDHSFKGDEPITGPKISLGELVKLLSQVRRTIAWGLKVTKGDTQNSLEGITPANLRTLDQGLTDFKASPEFKKMRRRCIGLPASAALLLFWELMINLCKYAKTYIRFSVGMTDRGNVCLKIENDAIIIPRTGRNGIEHIRNVAHRVHVIYDTPPRESESIDHYWSSIEFPATNHREN